MTGTDIPAQPEPYTFRALFFYFCASERSASEARSRSRGTCAKTFLIVLAIAALYVRYGGISWMQGAFYGVGAAVIAIIGRSATNLLKKTLKRAWDCAPRTAETRPVATAVACQQVTPGGRSSARGAVRGNSTRNSVPCSALEVT